MTYVLPDGSDLKVCPGSRKSEQLHPAEQSAQSAGLCYVTDTSTGIRRVKRGNAFSYVGVGGKVIRDKPTLQRIGALVIPPAWKNVWICPNPAGHLQATGRDERGRKQYKYHAQWRRVRDETKYDRMLEFARALPGIRRRVARDLKAEGLSRTKVLGTIVRLLETTLIRVGSEEYARENNSYGLTTMRNRHVKVSGTNLKFAFTGKSGKAHEITLKAPRLARIVRRCLHLPGQELFQYLDESGEAHSIGSGDVNEYLHEITGNDFTAKDFRTWAGTCLAVAAFCRIPEFNSLEEAKHNTVTVVAEVARCLGNTPAVCRKCYIHPTILESYANKTLLSYIGRDQATSEKVEELQLSPHKIIGRGSALGPEELAVLTFLRRLKKESKPRRARKS